MRSFSRMPRDIWIFIAGYLAAFHVGKLPPILPILQQDLGISLTQAGLALSLVQGAGMLFALSIGAFAEKLGLKNSLMLGLICLGLGSLSAYMIDSLWLLYVGRFLEGIGFLTISLCAPALLKKLSPPERLNLKMGIWSSYMGIGVAVAMITVPWLLHVFSWQSVWMLSGGLSLLLAAMVYWHLPTIKADTPSISGSGFLQLVKMTLTHLPIWALAVIFACYTSQWITLVGFLPTLYVEHHIDLAWAGALTAIVVIANLGGTFGAGLLLQKGIKPLYLICIGFITMCSMCSLTFTQPEWLNFTGQFMAAILFSMVGGLIPTTIFAHTLHYAPQPNAVASSMGLVTQVSALAQFSIPPLSAWWVSQQQQWSNIAWVSLCLSALGLLMAYQLFKPKQV